MFEISHRALGWTGLCVLWTADLMGRKQRAEDNGHNITHRVVDDPGFWFQTLATVLVILPWLCVRKRDVTSVISPLEDNIVIRFTDQGVGAGLFTRISRSPLREWHTFAGALPAPLLRPVWPEFKLPCHAPSPCLSGDVSFRDAPPPVHDALAARLKTARLRDSSQLRDSKRRVPRVLRCSGSGRSVLERMARETICSCSAETSAETPGAPAPCTVSARCLPQDCAY